MAHTTLGELCQQPTLKASSDENAQLVYDSTSQLHQALESILSALNLRAMAMSKSASFESALRDANVMQQLSPFSPLGNLRAAEVYAEQGKQSHFIDVCSKGLDIADTMHPHYATVQQMTMDARERQHTVASRFQHM